METFCYKINQTALNSIKLCCHSCNIWLNSSFTTNLINALCYLQISGKMLTKTTMNTPLNTYNLTYTVISEFHSIHVKMKFRIVAQRWPKRDSANKSTLAHMKEPTSLPQTLFTSGPDQLPALFKHTAAWCAAQWVEHDIITARDGGATSLKWVKAEMPFQHLILLLQRSNIQH